MRGEVRVSDDPVEVGSGWGSRGFRRGCHLPGCQQAHSSALRRMDSPRFAGGPYLSSDTLNTPKR